MSTPFVLQKLNGHPCGRAKITGFRDDMYEQLQIIGYPAGPRLWRWNCGLEDGIKEIEHQLGQ